MLKPFLKSNRLYLRKFTNKDLYNLFNLNSDPEVMKHIGRKPVTDIKKCEIIIKQILDYYKKHSGFGAWTAYKNNNDKFVGFFVLQHLDNTEEIEVGFRLMKKYWNRGFATEMTNQLIKYGVSEKSLDKIVGITNLNNIASQRVLEKSGLKYIKNARFYNTDVRYYAIYRNELQSKIKQGQALTLSP